MSPDQKYFVHFDYQFLDEFDEPYEEKITDEQRQEVENFIRSTLSEFEIVDIEMDEYENMAAVEIEISQKTKDLLDKENITVQDLYDYFDYFYNDGQKWGGGCLPSVHEDYNFDLSFDSENFMSNNE